MELWQPTCRELGSTERWLLLHQHQKFFTTPPAKAFFKASAGVEPPQDPGVGGGWQEELERRFPQGLVRTMKPPPSSPPWDSPVYCHLL